MAAAKKVVQAARNNPKGVRFSDLEKVVKHMGYSFSRQNGSHRSFRHASAPGITLQSGKDGMAKPYQVRQVLAIMDEYDLPEKEEE
ncbi:MAG TPA: type II toxin-antitoxin system HicA family toxin [Kofleriaceae bacterium]|nr:type II toxin-antitoxin system HicA family toxin [Kofleriaceae bacterium]